MYMCVCQKPIVVHVCIQYLLSSCIDRFYIEVVPTFEVTLGDTAFLPFRAASEADGSVLNTPEDFISVIEPGGDACDPRFSLCDLETVELFQVSPYNFGLLMSPVTLANNASYTIIIFRELLAGRKRDIGIHNAVSVNVIVKCKCIAY